MIDDDAEGGSVAGVWGAPEIEEPPADAHPFAIPDGTRYDRGGLLGAGGMGRVFTARDRRLNREVALKEVTVSAGRSGRSRLAQEAWITAQLEHPSIVPVHDAGTDADGTPWYTMRLIRGRTLHDVLDGADRATRLGTLRHILAACEAVAYAHSRGIVHRDLKPQNILVGGFGETQVADWGLARPLEGEWDDWEDVVPAGHAAATMVGAAIGTPAWMSPEQIRGEPATRRSDVWSLGAVLRQVVTGQPPWAGLDAEQVLSQRLSSDDEQLLRSLDGPDALASRAELAAIVRRAMAPFPPDRYADAAELSADLERYLDGRRVHAHEYSALDLVTRLARLWRAPLAVGLIGGVLLAVAVGVGWTNTVEQRTRAQHNLGQALLYQARTALETGDRPRAEVLATEVLAIEESVAARGVLAALAGAPRPRVDKRPVDAGSCDSVRLVVDGIWVCAQDTSLTAFHVDQREPLWSREAPKGLLPLVTAEGELFAATLNEPLRRLDPTTGAEIDQLATPIHMGAIRTSPDGRWLATWRANHLLLWDRVSGQSRPVNPCGHPVVITAAIPTDSELLVICADGRAGLIPLTTADTPLLTRMLPPDLLDEGLSAGRWLDGDRFLVPTHLGALNVYDARANRELQSISVTEHGLLGAEPLDDGRVVVRGERGDLWLVDLDTEDAVPLPGSRARDAAVTGPNELTVLGSELARWTLPPRAPRRVLPTDAGVGALRLSPDGSTLAAGTGNGRVLLWQPETARAQEVRLFDSVIKDLTFDPAGELVIAVVAQNTDEPIRAIRVSDGGRAPVLAMHRTLRRLRGLSNGMYIGLNWNGNGPLGASGHDEQLEALSWSDEPLFDLATDRAGRLFGLVGEDGRVVLAAAEDSLPRKWEATVSGAGAIGVHATGLVAIGRASGVTLLQDGETVAQLEAPTLQVTSLAFSPDGRTLAAGDLSGAIWIWDVPSGRLLADLRGHRSRISGLAFRDDRELVSASWDKSLRRWDLTPLRRSVPELRQDIAAWGLDLEAVLETR